MQQTRLALGGVVIGLRLPEPPDPDLQALLHGWFSPYLVDDRPADVVFDVSLRGAPLEYGPELAIRVTGQPGERCFHLERTDLEGVLDEAAGTGHLTVKATKYSVDSALRTILCAVLPGLGGALVHAAAIVHAGRGYMFPGPSGAGKSTLSRTAVGDPLLSDEISVIRREDERWVLYGAPFHGDVEIQPRAMSLPLHGIVFPDRSLPRGVHPLRPAAVAVRLIGTIINYASDDARLDADLLAVAHDLATTVPAVALSFDPGEDVWALIEPRFAT